MIQTNDAERSVFAAWKAIPAPFALLALALASMSIVVVAGCHSRPHSYLAEATLEVRPGNGETSKSTASSKEPSYALAYVATQIEVLQSPETLGPVIQKLDLTNKLSSGSRPLSPAEALAALRALLVLSEIRSTNLITIGVTNKDPELATTIANTIADTYREGRLKLAEQSLDTSLRPLKELVENQRKRVAEEHQTAVQLLASSKIFDPDPQDPSASIAPITAEGLHEGTEASKEGAINEAKNKFDQFRAKLEAINRLKPEELLENLKTLNIESDTVRKVLPLLQDIKVEEQRMLQLGLGENHPHIREDRAAEEQYKNILLHEAESIRRAQTEQLKVAEDALHTLTENLATSKVEAAVVTQKTHDYVNAKTKYLEDKRTLDALSRQYDAELQREKEDSLRVNIWEADAPTLSQ